jgi:hypothetical protein
MYGGIFNNPEMMAIQRASDQKAFQNAGMPSEDELRRIGKDYFKNYGQKSGVNPAFFNTLDSQNMDYLGIARALLDTQNNPQTFGTTNEYLKSLGLGYSPQSMPSGVRMPSSGIPGYN